MVGNDVKYNEKFCRGLIRIIWLQRVVGKVYMKFIYYINDIIMKFFFWLYRI